MNPPFAPDSFIFMAIAGAALVTYGLRLGGLLLAEHLPKSGGFSRFLAALPGTILLSLVAPSIVSAGLLGVVAALSTALCAWKTRNVFLGMILGMGIVAAGRWWMGC
ncbi:AzlD domain-containing protein [uncultured Desulfosarcina sp.]|uniref:AzlD family protein n=1 Tax=uncultured Desulfosarcina sp. TaxID=218289 RepID=UPI0029C63E14|nr:AzlD domain-containing protein [uncultured Desulfosarcina sp.]